MRKLFIIAALMAASVAHGATANYDEKAAMRQMILEPLVIQTVDCMRTGAAARLHFGERNTNAIAQWLATTCGIPLGRYMIDNMGFAPRDASLYIFTMGHAAIRETPGFMGVSK